MKEDLLHYIWQFRQYSNLDIYTQDRQLIHVVKTGILNHHAGPDFENSSIKISQLLWNGDVEVHLKSSDWNRHKHHTDKSYNKVILHVVWQDDKEIFNQAGEKIPTLELSGIVDESLLSRYKFLMENKKWIPCQDFFEERDQFAFHQFLDRLLIERLEQKSKHIHATWLVNNKSWEQTFYQFFCSALGLKINAEPMFQLAKLLPLSVLAKHRDSVFQLEAMLFGVAGFLSQPVDNYSSSLHKEFLFLQHKYSLEQMDKSSWKFMRLRPAGFPTVRLAQIAQLTHVNSSLFSKIINMESLEQFKKLFDFSVSEYWLTHYSFGKKSASRKKSVGESLVKSIIINTVSPILFVYSRQIDDCNFQEKSLDWLVDMSPEDNHIIRKFNNLGLVSKNSAHTQSLLQLKKNYCNAKKCLNCNIGNHYLSK